MGYIESTLGKGEEVVERFKMHWLPFAAAGIWVLIFLLLSLTNPAMLAVAAIPALLVWSLKSIEQGVTNRRVIVKRGIISRDTNELRAEKVEHVNVRQGIAGRIFGYGDVLVQGTGGGVVRIRTVAQPLQVKAAIEEALRLG